MPALRRIAVSLLIAAALSAASIWLGVGHGARQAEAAAAAHWQAERAQLVQRAASQAEIAASAQQTADLLVQELIRDAHTRQAPAELAAAQLPAAVRGLRTAATTAAGRSAATAAPSATAAAGGAPAAAPGDLCADVLAAAADRAAALAAEADRRGAAGSACQAYADRVIPAALQGLPIDVQVTP